MFVGSVDSTAGKEGHRCRSSHGDILDMDIAVCGSYLGFEELSVEKYLTVNCGQFVIRAERCVSEIGGILECHFIGGDGAVYGCNVVEGDDYFVSIKCRNGELPREISGVSDNFPFLAMFSIPIYIDFELAPGKVIYLGRIEAVNRKRKDEIKSLVFINIHNNRTIMIINDSFSY